MRRNWLMAVVREFQLFIGEVTGRDNESADKVNAMQRLICRLPPPADRLETALARDLALQSARRLSLLVRAMPCDHAITARGSMICSWVAAADWHTFSSGLLAMVAPDQFQQLTPAHTALANKAVQIINNEFPSVDT